MLALACMMVFAVGVAASVRWFLSQGVGTIAGADRPVAGGSGLAANHGIAIGGKAGNAGNPGSTAPGETAEMQKRLTQVATPRVAGRSWRRDPWGAGWKCGRDWWRDGVRWTGWRSSATMRWFDVD
jgi:hypothetical protein